jgi:molecular chaperone GrpE
MTDKNKKEEATPRFQVTDKRFWAADESIIEQAEPGQPRFPSFVEELKARTEAAERKLHERIESLQRENDAFRERLDRQVEQRVRRGKAELLRDLLEVVDNLERALEAASESPDSTLREGVALNLELFLSKLSTGGVEPIDSQNEPFDPNVAEAIGTVVVNDPELDGKIVEVVQKGYQWDDQLLRPAIVRVGRFEGI